MSKALILSIVLAAAPASAAELLRNGNFNDTTGFAPNDPSGGMQLQAGSTAIPGWRVAQGSVLWAGPNGLDPTTTDRGSALVNAVVLRAEADAVEQVIDRLPDMLRFQASGEIRTDGETRDRLGDELEAIVEGADDPLPVSIIPLRFDGQPQRWSFDFGGRVSALTGAPLILRLIRRGTGGYIAIDNISVSALDGTAVPEPASWALMIGGFGMVGGALRRRAKVRTTVSFA